MVQYDRVSFVCPFCGMQSGWNEKRKLWDGVQVANKENPSCLQYAHPRCAPQSARKHA